MSTLTKVWTEDKIRSIIRKLDEKTGLDGASLPIKLAGNGKVIGYYRHADAGEKSFGFKPKFINDPNTKEAEVIDLIRHEYAHYYVDVAQLNWYIGHSSRETSHGADWRWACKMVGAIPTRCHNATAFSDKNWTFDEAVAAYNANDVHAFDILSHLRRWHKVPIDADSASKTLARIKERYPDTYCDIGDKVLHPKRGFGIVEDAIPDGHWIQKIYVRFEDQTDGVFDAKEICKIVDGVVISL